MLIAWLPVEEPDLTVGPTLFAERRVLAVPTDHELTRRTSISLEAVSHFQHVDALPYAPETEPIRALAQTVRDLGPWKREDDLGGQPNPEGRALAVRALGGRAAAVRLGQVAYDRQAEAAAAGLSAA